MRIRERPPVRVRGVSRRAPLLPEGARLRHWVERLAIPRHAVANARGNAWVREELRTALEREGFSVRLQGPLANVVALPPETNGRPLVVLAAHYDSVPDCPGADDNASGLAVMLECARVLSAANSAGSGGALGFVAFNAEEDGLLGSRDFVAHCGHHVRIAHVLEMVGFRSRSAGRAPLPWPLGSRSVETPDYLGLVTKGGSNAVADAAARSTASPDLRVLTAKTWGPLHWLIPDLARSDHFSFWKAGIKAALWTDTANFRNPNYHRASDTPDTLDYPFMRDVAELLSDVLASEAFPS